MQELLDKCHPLGMFDSISTLAVASNMRELYRLVLVDTPLAGYFSESLTAGTHTSMCTSPCACLQPLAQSGLNNLDVAQLSCNSHSISLCDLLLCGSSAQSHCIDISVKV